MKILLEISAFLVAALLTGAVTGALWGYAQGAASVCAAKMCPTESVNAYYDWSAEECHCILDVEVTP